MNINVRVYIYFTNHGSFIIHLLFTYVNKNDYNTIKTTLLTLSLPGNPNRNLSHSSFLLSSIFWNCRWSEPPCNPRRVPVQRWLPPTTVGDVLYFRPPRGTETFDCFFPENPESDREVPTTDPYKLAQMGESTTLVNRESQSDNRGHFVRVLRVTVTTLIHEDSPVFVSGSNLFSTPSSPRGRCWIELRR